MRAEIQVIIDIKSKDMPTIHSAYPPHEPYIVKLSNTIEEPLIPIYISPSKQHMIPGNLSQLKIMGWTAGFLVVCSLLYLVIQPQVPKFEGHTMDWWLDDFSQTNFQSGPHLTERQQKGIQAFQYFGKQGFEFLLDEMSIPRGFISRYKIEVTRKLRQTSWGKYLGFKQRASRGEQAGFLFRHLEYPLEWTGVQLRQFNSATFYEMYYATMVLQQATNHQTEIIRSMGPLLNHTNASWTNLAAGTIAKLYQKVDTVPDLAVYLPGMPPIQDTTAMMTILSKHVDQSLFAKDRLLQLAEGPESEQTFARTTFLLSAESTKEDAIQKLKTMLLSANNRNRPFKGPLLSYIQPSPSLPSTYEYLALLEASGQPLTGLQSTLLKIAKEMENLLITLQVARLHRFQNWDNTEIIDNLLNHINQHSNWNSLDFIAFLSILQLEPKHAQAWDLFHQAMLHSTSQDEFLKKLDQAKESQQPYRTITSYYDNLDYRPYYEIGKKTLELVKATESDSTSETDDR